MKKIIIVLSLVIFSQANAALRCIQSESRLGFEHDVLFYPGHKLITSKNRLAGTFFSRNECLVAATECKQVALSRGSLVQPSEMGLASTPGDHGLIWKPGKIAYYFQYIDGEMIKNSGNKLVKAFSNKKECNEYQLKWAAKN